MSRRSLDPPSHPAEALGDSAIRWRVAPEWRELLLGPRGLRLDEWAVQGRVHVVKHGAHRTVYRVDLPRKSVYLKIHRVRALSAITHLLRGSAAWREWQNAHEVRRRRVATATPIALGEVRRGGLVRESVFVSEAVPDACTLDRYVEEHLPRLPQASRARAGRQLVVALARFCADMHERGIAHADFHRGNVLVPLAWATEVSAERLPLAAVEGPTAVAADTGSAAVDAAAPQLHLIDLPKVTFSRSLAWRASCNSLATFAAAWLERSSRTERWRFWREYLLRRPGLHVADRARAADEVVRRAAAHGTAILRSRDKRALADNRDFRRIARDTGIAYAVRDVAEADLQTILQDPERVLHGEGAQTLKRGVVSYIVRTQLTVADEKRRVFYKRSQYRNWIRALLGCLRRSRAVRGFYLGHALLERGVATPRPLLACERRRTWLPWNSYLATDWVDGENLRDWGTRLDDIPRDARIRLLRQASAALARLLGRLHACGFAHPDLKPGNLLLTDSPEGVRAWLIDLDGGRLRRHMSDARRAFELGRLAKGMAVYDWISRTDQLRFLRAYQKIAPLRDHDWKWFWRRTARRSRQLLELRDSRRRNAQAVATKRAQVAARTETASN